MTEQIYINGTLMERADGSPASLVWQSPFLTEIDSIVSNRSNSVDFPPTRGNLKAVDNCHLSGSGSAYAYRRHSVQYFRDGVQLFSGFATLLSITSSAIRFSFTWGSVEAFQTLLDLRLRDVGDIVHATTHVRWKDGEMGSHDNANIYWGTSDYPRHPVMAVSDILRYIQTASGVTFDNAELFADYIIPLVTKDADELAKRYNGVVLRDGETYIYNPSDGRQLRDCCLVPFIVNDNDYVNDSDLAELYVGDGLYDVSDIDEVRLVIPDGGWAFRTRVTYNGDSRAWKFCDLTVYAVDEDGNGGVEIATIGTRMYDSDGEWEWYRIEGDTELTVNVEDYSYITLCVNRCSRTEEHADVFSQIEVVAEEVYLYDTAEQEVLPGGMFPLWANLPDWDCSLLLKNLMKVEGVFPLVRGSDEVEFVSIDILHSNRPEAVDWSGRLVLSGGRPEEIATQLDGYARTNLCKWAEDDTVTGDHDGSFAIDDETLDAETELMALDFAATDTRSDGRVAIRSYSLNDEDEVEFTEVEPRLLRLDALGNAVFGGLDWDDIIANKYTSYLKMVDRPRVVTAQVLLDAVPLAEIDLTKPVYASQFGHYYAVRKLTTKDAGLAEAELIELGADDPRTEDVVTTTGLVLVQDADGDWCATLADRTASEIAAMIALGTYKVCVIRWGYARRGKYRVIENRTTTHTDRKLFRVYRHGLRWRIIGMERLVTGRLSGQCARSEVYSGATLVLDLKEKIVLPSTANRKRYVTKGGRVTNRDKDGLSELYIGLYHRNDQADGKVKAEARWELVSNIVQVRGRNASNTEIWDFVESNVVLKA